MPKPNPNKIDRQKTPDSPPPPFQGERDAPGDQTDWVEVAHEEADAAVPAPRGNPPGGTKPKPPRTSS
jgi:hypothetical protein